MHIQAIYRLAHPKFVEKAAKHWKIDLEKSNFKDHREDYHIVSPNLPIMAIADGVTVEPNENGVYPSPSGAGDVSKIFCETIIEEIEKIYENIQEADLTSLFIKANRAVSEYNKSQGRTEQTINYWDHDLFACTAALAIIKKDKVFWATICDAYISHYDADGKQKFKSPNCGYEMSKHLPLNWDKIPFEVRKKIIRKVYRNGVNERGEPIGYGAVTGEPDAEKYLNFGSFDVSEGDFVLLFTDGFENHLRTPEFGQLIIDYKDQELEEKINEFNKQKIPENPEKFGHEGTLVIVRL